MGFTEHGGRNTEQGTRIPDQGAGKTGLRSPVSGILSPVSFFVLYKQNAGLHIWDMATDSISIKFAGRILQEEWGDFERRHRSIIEKRIYQRPNRKESSGTLRRSRSYDVKTNEPAQQATATLKHPDYERFIDMRKKFYGDRRVGRMGKILPQRGVLFSKRGIAIHNRMIWGKLNPISFRLINDLRSEVVSLARAKFSGVRSAEPR